MMENNKGQKKGLGRGLSALFEDEGAKIAGNPSALNPDTDNPDHHESGANGNHGTSDRGPLAPGVPEHDPANTPKTLPIELLKPNPHQPRQSFDETELLSLTNSILAKGILQPILVRAHPDFKGNYQIVAGERRWRAAQQAKLHEVPVVILKLNDTDTLEIALIENIHRQDLNVLEEAEAYQQLISRYGYTQETVAKSVGKSRSHIANLMRLLTLPEEIKAMLQDGHISMGHARALLSSKKPLAVANQVIEKGLNVRQCERLIQQEQDGSRLGSDSKQDKKTSKTARNLQKSEFSEASDDPNSLAIARDLTNLLSMNTKILLAPGSASGQVVIEFNDFEQLDDLIELLNH